MMPVFSPVSCPPAPCCPSSFRCHAPASPGFFFPIRCYACPVLPVLSSMPHSGKFLIFLSYPMLCLPRVARPPFGVMLCKEEEIIPPFIVIARLGKAEYLESLRQIPSLPVPVIANGWGWRRAGFRHTPLPPFSSLRGLGKPKQSGITFESLYKCFYKE